MSFEDPTGPGLKIEPGFVFSTFQVKNLPYGVFL
jgi:hypothetical protein